MHCIHDITPTISEMAYTVSVSWRLYWWSQTNSIYNITTSLRMTLMHSTQGHIHTLWLHTMVVITLHPLHLWHHTPYIWHHTHGNTNVISAIWPAISNTTFTVSMTSKRGYQLYHNDSLYDITQTICVTSYSVCMLSKQLFMTSYPSVYNITTGIFMTSYPIHIL